MTEHEKQVDEAWKESAENEKEILSRPPRKGAEHSSEDAKESKIPVNPPIKEEDEEMTLESPIESPQPSEKSTSTGPDVNFINYLTSLGYQTMIFLGEIPHPATNQTEENLDQAKFLIDTLAMLREKTKGNLHPQEENLLNASIYELQMKYVEKMSQPSSQGGQDAG